MKNTKTIIITNSIMLLIALYTQVFIFGKKIYKHNLKLKKNKGVEMSNFY